MSERERSPRRISGKPQVLDSDPYCQPCGPSVSAEADVAEAHAIRMAYAPPKQSGFRVGALLRFRRTDGSFGVIKGANAEPHDANIRGAICAERIAMGEFQRTEAARGAKICRVVCVTDFATPIFPGACCREFLTATLDPDVEVIASGAEDASAFQTLALHKLLPLPSVYIGQDQKEMLSLGESLSKTVTAPTDDRFQKAYAKAAAYAKRQGKQASVFPILFAAAAQFSDGRVHAAAELKGMEYGCTVDAVSLLLPEMLRSREEDDVQTVSVVQVDNFGIAHAPFAAARALMVEHGLGDVLVCAHDRVGKWTETIVASQAMPSPSTIF